MLCWLTGFCSLWNKNLKDWHWCVALPALWCSLAAATDDSLKAVETVETVESAFSFLVSQTTLKQWRLCVILFCIVFSHPSLCSWLCLPLPPSGHLTSFPSLLTFFHLFITFCLFLVLSSFPFITSSCPPPSLTYLLFSWRFSSSPVSSNHAAGLPWRPPLPRCSSLTSTWTRRLTTLPWTSPERRRFWKD